MYEVDSRGYELTLCDRGGQRITEQVLNDKKEVIHTWEKLRTELTISGETWQAWQAQQNGASLTPQQSEIDATVLRLNQILFGKHQPF